MRAKAPVMVDTIEYIRNKFGSIDGFLDKYGFDESWRVKLRFVTSLKLISHVTVHH